MRSLSELCMYYRFDQTVHAVQSMGGEEDWTVLCQQMQAQLFFHAASLLLMKAQQVLFCSCYAMGRVMCHVASISDFYSTYGVNA